MLTATTPREEEARARARERALARARRASADARAKRASARARELSKVRRWSARESEAFTAYLREPTRARYRAWLATWHEQPGVTSC
jgi:hypothetical protein